MTPNEVVITGIGMVSPLGTTARENGEAWRAGATAPRKHVPEFYETVWENYEVGTLPPLDVAHRLGDKQRMLKYMSAAAQIGCVAAHEALLDASTSDRFSPERVGLYAGVGLAAGDLPEIERVANNSVDTNGMFSCKQFSETGLAAANPLFSFKILANMPPCLISIMENIKGPNLIFTPWEGQTGAALEEAWRAVAEGEVDCALTGAADSPAHPVALVHLRHTGMLSEQDFPSNAAAYLVLERREFAERDGRHIYARLKSVRSAVEADGGANDPIARRVGRTFAAAPAIALALSALTTCDNMDISDFRGARTLVQLEAGK